MATDAGETLKTALERHAASVASSRAVASALATEREQVTMREAARLSSRSAARPAVTEDGAK